MAGELARRAAAEGVFGRVSLCEVGQPRRSEHAAATSASGSKRRRRRQLDLLGARAVYKVAELITQTEADVVAYLGLCGAPRPDAHGEFSDAEAAGGFARGLLRAHRRGQVPKRLLVLSWTAVYGVARGAPLLFRESFAGEPDEPEPLSPVGRWAAGLRAAEAELRDAAEAAGVQFCLLRAAPVVAGPAASIVGDFLSSRVPMRVLGYDPPFQVLHYDDLIDAVETALVEPVSGTLNLSSRGTVPLSRLAALAGSFATPVPAAVVRRLGPSAPGPARLRWRCLADVRRAVQVLGITPRFAAEDAVVG